MPDGRKRPQSILKANQQFDDAHIDTKDCYTCLLNVNCTQCVYPCYGGPPGECFACILPTCPTCLRPCGFPRIAKDVENFVTYSDVKITNNLTETVYGKVFYLWLGHYDFKIPAGGSVSIDRGGLLITKIDARRADEKKPCTPYQSTGTSYSQFEVTNLGIIPGCVVIGI
eukprot:GFUD01046271.1.p1 GENE.GFUD01046271.1~~GFUD01046271.1.p1  ORF type:complete len:195 (+),score=22.99 GFUD01046271.1:78-587(+)